MIARALVAVGLAVLATSAVAGQRYDYVLHCAGCHKPDGSGSEVVPALDETGMMLSIPGGREYLASVPGVAQAPLSDERLAALLNWMLREMGGRAPVPGYTASEVGRLRKKPLREPVAERNRLLADAAK